MLKSFPSDVSNKSFFKKIIIDYYSTLSTHYEVGKKYSNSSFTFVLWILSELQPPETRRGELS